MLQLLLHALLDVQNKTVTQLLRDPARPPARLAEKCEGKAAPNGGILGSEEVPEGFLRRLQRDAERCMAWDDMNSPLVTAAQQSAGRKGEAKIEEELRLLGIDFMRESDLRGREQAKTPDVLLSMPVAAWGRVVHWIDSKAGFGDPETHKDVLGNQLAGYANRFGPGMVVYALGFVEGLPAHSGVLVSSRLPQLDEIEFLRPC